MTCPPVLAKLDEGNSTGSRTDCKYDADGNPTQGIAQAREALEAGSLPAESNVNYASNIATEEDVYQGTGFIDTGGNE